MAWERTADVYTTPSVRLDVDGAPWLADAAITSWSLERELVGSTLPSNIRARTGLSVGDATVNVTIPGAQPTPWDPDADRAVTTGAVARLYADATGDGSDTFDLGQWRTDATTGSLLSGEVPINLVEAQYRGRKLTQAVPPLSRFAATNTAPDPVWLIDVLARQIGYRGVVWPVPDTLLAQFPLAGAFEPSAGDYLAHDSSCGGWGTPTGIVGPDGPTIMQLFGVDVQKRLAAGDTVTIWLKATGTVRILDPLQLWDIVLDADAKTVQVRNDMTTAAYVAGSWSADLDLIRVEIQRDFHALPTGLVLSALELRVRVNGGAWVSESTDTGAGMPAYSSVVFLGGYETDYNPTPAAGSFSAVQIGAGAWADDPDPANADLAVLGGQLTLPYLDPTADAWTAIQTVCEKWLAAAYIDRDGAQGTDGTRSPRLVVIDRDTLAGADTAGTPTEVGEEWTDIPWTLDPADVADRLEVTYNPPTITAAEDGSSDWWPTAWSSEDVITLPANSTTTVHAEVEVGASNFAPTFWGAWWTPGPDVGLAGFSTYSIFDNLAGSGSHLPEGSVLITTTVVSATRVDITLTNHTSAPVYFVDANGDPCLILRAERTATFDTQRTIARGADSQDAQSPLSIDLAALVQTDADASAIADYLWSRVSTPLWKASSVQCRLDWRHDLAEVLALSHPRTGLDAKAMVVKVAYDGAPGAITQSLDLVLLPRVWFDFDAAWAAQTWADFDAAWAAQTWADFDNSPLAGA